MTGCTGSPRSTASSRAITFSTTSASTATCAKRSAAIRTSRTPPASAKPTTRRRSTPPMTALRWSSSSPWSGAFSRHRSARSTLALPSPAEEPSMKLWSRAALVAAVLLTAACRVAEQDNSAQPNANETAAVAPILTTDDAKDIHSYARPLEARVHHVDLDLAVDFDAKQIGGSATLDIQRSPEAKEIILDDKGLEIQRITD